VSGVDWNFIDLEQFVYDRGDTVVHEIAIACTCRAEDTYASIILKDGTPARIRRMDCRSCHGDGFIYRNARCIVGLITGVHPGNRRLIDAGYALPGDCTFSPALDAGVVGDLDKITFTKADTVDEGQIILRGAHTLDANRLVETDLLPQEDRLWYNSECSIWCEDQNGVIYDQNVDFTLKQNKIIWNGARGPDVGIFYTIKYTAFLEWSVYVSPMSRSDRGRSLGDRVVLKKKHIIFINEFNKATPELRTADQKAFTSRRSL